MLAHIGMHPAIVFNQIFGYTSASKVFREISKIDHQLYRYLSKVPLSRYMDFTQDITDISTIAQQWTFTILCWYLNLFLGVSVQKFTLRKRLVLWDLHQSQQHIQSTIRQVEIIIFVSLQRRNARYCFMNKVGLSHEIQTRYLFW